MRNILLAAAAVGLLLFCVALAQGQDAVKVAPAHYKVKVENAHVRVIENTLAPGEKDPMHTHPAGWFYVTRPGTMKVVHADGKTVMWEAKEGEAGWMEAEGPHTSENVGKTTMGFILVEVKSAASKAAAAGKSKTKEKK
ncbi:MAG: cupin domain-containing protein [Acidobacteriia bacterium]|nr:cupin domain-containing protein [Terriglobia bacterium]